MKLFLLGLLFSVSTLVLADEAPEVKAYKKEVSRMSKGQRVKAQAKALEKLGDCIPAPFVLLAEVFYQATGPYEGHDDLDSYTGTKMLNSCAEGYGKFKILNEKKISVVNESFRSLKELPYKKSESKRRPAVERK